MISVLFTNVEEWLEELRATAPLKITQSVVRLCFQTAPDAMGIVQHTLRAGFVVDAQVVVHLRCPLGESTSKEDFEKTIKPRAKNLSRLIEAAIQELGLIQRAGIYEVNP